ncbi:3D domain-containing protein [Psychrobacillus phage Perkons]|nr:3D domain-containing protein [Psychrobacillus phage Perkons]
MKKNTLIKSLLATTVLSSSMTFGLGYKVNSNDKYIKTLEDEGVAIQNDYSDLMLNIGEMNAELDTYKEVNDELATEIELKNDEIDKLKKSVSSEKDVKKKEVVVSRGSEDDSTTKIFEVTFYSADYQSTGKSKGDKDFGLTASGSYVKEGRTLACPKSMKFGTKVYIEGVGYRTCEDRGGLITEGHLDVYVDSQSKAMELGRQKLQVRILNNN